MKHKTPLAEKRCTGCGEVKPVWQFYLRDDGYYYSQCRHCTIKRVHKNYVPKKKKTVA